MENLVIQYQKLLSKLLNGGGKTVYPTTVYMEKKSHAKLPEPFGDLNISSPIRAFIEKPNSKVTIINDRAEEIKSSIFSNHLKVQAVPQKIEDWMPSGINTIQENIQAVQKEIKEQQKKENQQRLELEKRIREGLKKELEANKPFSLSTMPSSLTSQDILLSGIPMYRFCLRCGQLVTPNENNCCPSCGQPLT
jgi:uncharacterized protein YoaH (UPF0181 family)